MKKQAWLSFFLSLILAAGCVTSAIANDFTPIRVNNSLRPDIYSPPEFASRGESNGKTSSDNMTFSYASNDAIEPTATPVPRVNVPVYYQDQYGRTLATSVMTLTASGYIYADDSMVPAGYTRTSSSSAYVTISGGTASPSSVTFTYMNTVTPTSKPVVTPKPTSKSVKDTPHTTAEELLPNAVPTPTSFDGEAFYLVPDSSERRMAASECWKWSYEALGYIYQEILARHGFVFDPDGEYFWYFNIQPWYHPIASGSNEDVYVLLNSVEWYNIDLIKRVREQMLDFGDKNPYGYPAPTPVSTK